MKWLTNYELDIIPNQSLKIWGRQENPSKFSEESSGTIHELGNIELHELGQISKTIQCEFCLKHILGRDLFSALVAFVLDLMRNKYKEAKPDSRL